MARLQMLDGDLASLGEGPLPGDMLFELGMMYSVGRDMPVDLVAAQRAARDWLVGNRVVERSAVAA